MPKLAYLIQRLSAGCTLSWQRWTAGILQKRSAFSLITNHCAAGGRVGQQGGSWSHMVANDRDLAAKRNWVLLTDPQHTLFVRTASQLRDSMVKCLLCQCLTPAPQTG